jgi:K(+)-stimulated pyrophosphate-energized sodium pump
MNGFNAASRLGRLTGPRAFLARLMAVLMALAPGWALAAGAEAKVQLQFTASDKIYLYVSLACGALAIAAAFWLRAKLMALSPGNEKMQEVGQAIREGAMAYLLRQVKTMIWFVFPLAVGIAALFSGDFGWGIGAFIGVSFMLGVAASYIAGYVGMLMAVNANMRTAHAALTSYKQSTEVAFQSGAVAGLVTVGMGLIGATIIFLVAGADAMKLLVGFGFGGSLAALFMRVGGGIFTKAADVGADLVGKVEAGIPEDDPRNPATIADNVGDNVGDCAGMAADVFESYEVTLVAAIVLGAATASIFDQSTWMKLILFALMARGVGIIASIIGIFMVKGSDDLDADPLKVISGGFKWSAIVAALGTLGLAWFMMGGMPGSKPIQASQLKSLETFRHEEVQSVRGVVDEVAAKLNKPKWQVTVADLQADEKIKDMKLHEPQNSMVLQAALMPKQPGEVEPVALKGFTPVDFTNPDGEVYNYAVIEQPTFTPNQTTVPKPTVKTFGEAYKDKKFFVYHLQIQRKASTDAEGKPVPAGEAQKIYFGPVEEKELDEQIKSVQAQVDVKKLPIEGAGDKTSVPARFYANADGDVALGIEADIPSPHRIVNRGPVSYYKNITKAELEKIMQEREADQTKPLPPADQASIAMASATIAPWYMFFLAIFFGIVMAFAIERLTDYYVSTHKAPVKEVAGVSSAGPAPMIIQGFALAAESSVFSVFSIVVALIFPLFLFPPEAYGGFILSFYGIALVGLGLLTTTGYILAMDTFGPISDNAQGIFEMSGAGHGNEKGSKAVQRLDAAGNTTKALTKGFAIATAVVAAVALFHSYIEDANLTGRGLPLDVPAIFLGMLIGGAAPYLFSAFSINAVGRASFDLINEVRRQFQADPGIMKGTSKPNYASCVSIVTAAAQKELLGPAILAIALPLAVGYGFSIGQPQVNINGQMYNLTGAQALGGFLAGAILSGQLLAVLLANSGGIWDNAKKVIEDGLYGGKGSEAHKAGIVCDTVGDPFKDTAGPALNPLIKVMNLVALLLAGMVIKPLPDPVLWVILIVCLSALAFSIWWSKRSSISTALTSIQAGQAAQAAIGPSGDGVAVAPKKRLTVADEPEEETTP